MPSFPPESLKRDYRGGVGAFYPSLERLRALSWRSSDFPELSWEQWLNSLFRPVLLPHLLNVQSLAAEQLVREVISLDLALSSKLPVESVQASITAGRELYLSRPPQGARVLKRLQQAVDTGEAPGHFSTFYALRAAVFCIPLQTTLLSYVMEELRVALPDGIPAASFLKAASRHVNDCMRERPDLEIEGLRKHG